MKVPISWLKDYVELAVDVKTLAERLTFAGIEVENIETCGADDQGAPEYVLNLEITPNRPDLLGLIGLAREVAALGNVKLKIPPGQPPENEPRVNDLAAVMVEDQAGCPRYIARVLTGVTVRASPAWLQRRLALAGIGSINNIVDITNYILLECGQPLHAFDLAKLADKKIIVRRAREGEQIVALDKAAYKLNPQMLVIADSSKPVAIAGVMGGEETGISTGTTTILLESACFQPALIRKTSKTLGLTSESSYRFERGVDINGVDFASRRAAALLADLAGARLARGALDVFAAPPPAREITCRYQRAAGLLGAEIPAGRVKAIFNALDLPVIAESAAQCTVKIKTFRPDLETETDLIEELARIQGLDKIPARDPLCRIVAAADDTESRAQLHCRRLLAALGLNEIVNYSFTSEKLLAGCAPERAAQRIVIPRPVSAEHAILRDSLLPQMIETLGRNKSRQIEEAGFFEIGRVFFKTPEMPFQEETRAAIGLMGAVGRPLLRKRPAPDEAEVFGWLKGILQNFYAKLNPPADRQLFSDGSDGILPSTAGNMPALPGFSVSCFKTNRVASIALDGKTCGVLGLLKDDIRREWRILEPVGLLEIALAPFWQHAFQTPGAAALPVYPAIKRDMALRVSAGLQQADILKIIWKNAPKELTDAVLFDIYINNEIGAGLKSLAYSLTYRSLDRTLTDAEVNELHAAVKARLKNELKVEMREG